MVCNNQPLFVQVKECTTEKDCIENKCPEDRWGWDAGDGCNSCMCESGSPVRHSSRMRLGVVGTMSFQKSLSDPGLPGVRSMGPDVCH